MLPNPLATQLLRQSQSEAELKRQKEADHYAVWREEQLKLMKEEEFKRQEGIARYDAFREERLHPMKQYNDVLTHIKTAYAKMGDTFDVPDEQEIAPAPGTSLATNESKAVEEVILGLPVSAEPKSIKQELDINSTPHPSKSNTAETKHTGASSSEVIEDAPNQLMDDSIGLNDVKPVIRKARKHKVCQESSRKLRRHKKAVDYRNEVELPSTVKKGDVLRQIQKYQRSGNLIIPRRVFRRIVKKICDDLSSQPMRMNATAIEALHEIAEANVTSMFADAVLVAVNAKRVTVMRNDLLLLRRFYGL
jgi:histone H3/H4